MYGDEENRPLVSAHVSRSTIFYVRSRDLILIFVYLKPQVRSRAKMYILIIMGLVILAALIGAIVTFSMWRTELEDQRNTNNTTTPSPSETPTSAPFANTPYSETPTAVPIAAPVASVGGLNQTFSSRMTVEEIMTILVCI